MTGKAPFDEVKNPTKFILGIRSCKIPIVEEAEGFAAYLELTKLLQRCWAQDPLLRPDAKECWRMLRWPTRVLDFSELVSSDVIGILVSSTSCTLLTQVIQCSLFPHPAYPNPRTSELYPNRYLRDARLSWDVPGVARLIQSWRRDVEDDGILLGGSRRRDRLDYWGSDFRVLRAGLRSGRGVGLLREAQTQFLALG